MEAQAPTEAIPLLGTRQVLYVEDRAVNAVLMKLLFESRRDLSLHVAETGSEGWELARQLQPALLLIDIHLPDCHGSALLHQLRELEHCARVPAIAVTADGSFDPSGSGFGEVWRKPLDVSAVLARMHLLLPPRPRTDPTLALPTPLLAQRWRARRASLL